MKPLMLLWMLFALVSAIAINSKAHAWGENGHRIIGAIAQDKISGRTAAQLKLYFGTSDLAEISTWADEERSNPSSFWQNDAGAFHFVTVPSGQEYSDIGAPPEGDGFTALETFVETVRNEANSMEERRLALHFITHIVGDLHQPLHVGNGLDKGGNDVNVKWFNRQTNLHRIWDTEMIESQNLSFLEFAERLDRAISAQDTINWWDPNVEVWINESAVIREDVYPSGTNPSLSFGYEYEHIPVVERRLQQGGVRLAAYLDWIFAEGLN